MEQTTQLLDFLADFLVVNVASKVRGNEVVIQVMIFEPVLRATIIQDAPTDQVLDQMVVRDGELKSFLEPAVSIAECRFVHLVKPTGEQSVGEVGQKRDSDIEFT